MAPLVQRWTCRAVPACICLWSLSVNALSRQTETPPVPIWGPESSLARDGRVFLSSDMHDIVVAVPGATGTPDRVVKVPLWNRLAPSVSEQIEQIPGGLIRYSFDVRNRASARDPIGAWSVLLPPADLPSQKVLSPGQADRRWGGSAMAGGPAVTVNQMALGLTEEGRYLQWFYRDADGVIGPGGSLRGFGIESPRLPGFTTAWFSSGKLVEFDQSWPEAIFRQLEKLEDKRWREVYLALIGPRFDTTDSRETVLRNFRTGVQAWIKAGRLKADSPFTSELVMLLNNPPESTTAHLKIQAPPGTETEKNLAQAVQLSLHIASQ